MIPISPQRGAWPFAGLPLAVALGGRVYRRSEWAFPYPHVVAQYREDRPEHSAHLHVFDDGSWLVDHLDESNPDFAPVAHLLDDVIGADPHRCSCSQQRPPW